jgi:phage-related protein
MPGIGAGCHELRITEARKSWRIVYRTDVDAVVIAEVFQKATAKTPKRVIDACAERLSRYDAIARG